MRYHENILSTIGNTPLVKLNKVTGGLKPLVLAKCEFFNPGGSVKDRIGVPMIEAAEKEGTLQPGGTIVEGTSGNTGVGLAIASAIKGYRTVFTMNDKQSREKQLLLKSFGARVIVCPTAVAPDHPDSYYSVAKRIHESTPNSIYPNQYFNQANPWAHYHTTGPEIWRDTEGKITHFFAGAGTGGTLSGVGKFLKEKNPDVKIIGADPRGSILKEYKETGEYHPEHAHTYKIEGIGEDIIPGSTWFEFIDELVTVEDEESFVMARRLAREEGIFTGGSAGTAVAGMVKWLRANPLPEDAVCVVLLPDSGSRYITKFFSDEWMAEQGYFANPGTAGEALLGKAEPHRVLSVKRSDPVRAAIDLMNAHGVSALPVLGEHNEPVGSLDERVVMSRAIADPAVLGAPADAHMGEPLPVVAPDAPVENAVELLSNHEAVLVGRGGVLEGVLTKFDLVRFLSRR